MGSIPVRVTNYVTRKWCNKAVCEVFLFMKINLATYFENMPLTLPLAYQLVALFCFRRKARW